MGLWDNIKTGIGSRIIDMFFGIIDDGYSDRARIIQANRAYRMGFQQSFLKESKDGFDDNQVSNYLGLIADRTVSMLFGQDVEFDYGETADETETETPIKDWVDEVWKTNSRANLLQSFGYNGAESGMAYCKIAPQGDGEFRLISLDSMLMDVITNPYDKDEVIRYIYQYKTYDLDGHEMGLREITEKNITPEELKAEVRENEETWTIEVFENTSGTHNKWTLVKSTPWDYPFPPIHHTQNLININDVWGLPDITEWLLGLQDQYNFNASNRNKIIRYYAHPMRYGRNVTESADMGTGPDKMINLSGTDASIEQLEALGDLMAVLSHMENIKQNMFETSRTVDINTLRDSTGSGDLTNFGLKVIYQDALQKLETKRGLYGEFLCEINRRLYVLQFNEEPPDCELLWPYPLPESAVEETTALQADLNMKVVSPETVSGLRGYQWDDELERMNAQEENTDDVGARILKAFDRNGGVQDEDEEPRSNV